jgi:hypothetical protein
MKKQFSQEFFYLIRFLDILTQKNAIMFTLVDYFVNTASSLKPTNHKRYFWAK